MFKSISSWSLFGLLGVLHIFSSCTEKTVQSDLPRLRTAMNGLAKAWELSPGKNVIYLSEYFYSESKIDSFHLPNYLKVEKKADRLILDLQSSEVYLDVAHFWIDSLQYDIPIFISNKKEETAEDNDSTDGLAANTSFKSPKLEAFEYNDTSVGLVSSNCKQLIAFWQNKQIAVEKRDNRTWLLIPDEARYMPRSYIRVMGANGPLKSPDILLPLENGKILNSADQLTYYDFHHLVMYEVLVDRFFNAHSSNDALEVDSALPSMQYKGGDILGVAKKIYDGYFQGLGVNGILLSPIVQNAKGAYPIDEDVEIKSTAYHGNWPISFTKIDPRLGTTTDLEELIDKAHREEINVMLDLAKSALIHKEHWVAQKEMRWLLRRTDSQLFHLDLNSLQLSQMLSDSIGWWAAKYGIDGFRHNANLEYAKTFERKLTQKLKLLRSRPLRPFFHLEDFPETYRRDGLSNGLKAHINSQLHTEAIAVFAKNANIQRLKEALEKKLELFGHHHLRGNKSGCEDCFRFVSYADGSVDYQENLAVDALKKPDEILDSIALDKLALLHAFNFSIPGVPVIYYGDEIGIAGTAIPDNRRVMRFEKLTKKEIELRETVAKLAELRHNNLPLIYGSTDVVYAMFDLIIIKRKYFDEVAYCIINNSSNNQEAELPTFKGQYKSNFGMEIRQDGELLTVQIPPNSFDIITTTNEP